MQIPKKHQLVLIFLGLVLFIGVATGFLVNSILSNRVVYEAQERVNEAVNAARWVYTSKINDIDRVTRLTAIRHVVMKALEENNPPLIPKRVLAPTRRDYRATTG